MSIVNYTTREISCRLVYYGPGRSGKTTNLRSIHEELPADRRTRLVSIATPSDRILFSEYLPLDLGDVAGFTTRFQLYTVPGRAHERATRQLVLHGVDGVVFVADSQARQLEENIDSLRDLHENLLADGVDVRRLPLVLQYNKQDLPPALVLSPAELDEALNFRGVPSFAADAVRGVGVFETLQALATSVLRQLSPER